MYKTYYLGQININKIKYNKIYTIGKIFGIHTNVWRGYVVIFIFMTVFEYRMDFDVYNNIIVSTEYHTISGTG